MSFPFSLYAEFERNYIDNIGTMQVLHLDDGSTNNRSFLTLTAGVATANVTAGGVLQAAVGTGSTLGTGATFKMAGSFDANDVRLYESGASRGSDTSVTAPGASTILRLCSGATNVNQMGGWLRRAAIFPRALSNAELQALTT
jgi:hypothetical protein